MTERMSKILESKRLIKEERKNGEEKERAK